MPDATRQHDGVAGTDGPGLIAAPHLEVALEDPEYLFLVQMDVIGRRESWRHGLFKQGE